MEEYLCITVVSDSDESREDFSRRLSQFWTHMLREFQSDFEKVYAETTEFEQEEDCWTRQYLVEEEVVELLERELQKADFDYDPIDPDDTYTKYEAAPPEWMQIEH